MSGGYTPGPWEWRYWGAGHTALTGPPCYGSSAHVPVNLSGGSADARLVAAAPELVDALREVLGWHDDADNLHKPIEVRAAYMRARALVTRIDGHTK